MEPSAVTIQESSEIAPTCAMLVGSMMMPEPIMLTATTTVRVTNQPPRAVIAVPARKVVNTDLTFDGSGSSDPDGEVVLWEWDLDGDGRYETTGARPVYRYATAGKRTIALRVTDAFGATATATAQITVTTS